MNGILVILYLYFIYIELAMETIFNQFDSKSRSVLDASPMTTSWVLSGLCNICWHTNERTLASLNGSRWNEQKQKQNDSRFYCQCFSLRVFLFVCTWKQTQGTSPSFLSNRSWRSHRKKWWRGAFDEEMQKHFSILFSLSDDRQVEGSVQM